MYKQEKSYYKRSFFYALLMAGILLLPFVIIDGGYFVFYGDYNAQQIPFYKTCIRAIHEGNLSWNWQTDLGVNFVGSYSFYTLGSPFFWLAALFPVSISQYLMAPLLALKLALSSLFAFIYIRRFVSKPDSALIGGLLYAFSGFSLNNVFFNHFHEAIVFFPLLLIGLEECVINKRRGAFAVAVAINAFVNYFFFIGECVFLVIYFVSRLCLDKRFRTNASDIICLGFESIVGVMIAGALFIPSIFQVLDVPRSTNILTDGNFMFYGREQRYGLLLEAMFFPPEVAARSNMFTEANAKWSSVALYLPMFSMAGVAAFIKGSKKNWISCVLIVCLMMAFIPGLNAAFTMFNNNFYTRWFYMPELICCLATVTALERCEHKHWRFGLTLCAVMVGLISLIVLLHPVTFTPEVKEGETAEKIIRPNFIGMSPAVWVQIAIAVAFLIVLGVFLRRRRRTSDIAQLAVISTVVCSMLLGYYFIGYGRILGPYIGAFNRATSTEIELPEEDGFVRMEVLDEINNINMMWDMSSLRSFTSIIPSSTFELYELLGITRDVNSAPEFDRYALRSLTGVKYFMIRENHDEKELTETLDKLEVYEYHSNQSGYDIYVNNYALPMGFAYDNYVSYKTMEGVSAKDKLLCRAVVLTDEQAEKYSDILTELPAEDSRVSSVERFKSDAEDRIAAGVADFEITNSGFTASTSYDSDELVVFSVPFDKGWSAEINGSPAVVEKVNGGLIAVRVSAGECDIVFTYETPGGKIGIICTIAGIVLLCGYILLWYVVLKRRPGRYAHLYATDQHEGISAHSSYIAAMTKEIASAEAPKVRKKKKK